MDESQSDLLKRLEKINAIGIALSAEKNTPRLLEMILEGAQTITNADAGTLYIVNGRHLEMAILRNDSLGLKMGGTTGNEVVFPTIELYTADGRPNKHTVVTYSVHHEETINIADAYDAKGFDFSGTREFDEKDNYRSKSFLTIPMKNHENDVIGVLQLINAQDKKTGEIILFSNEDQRLAESLASQAAVALTNKNLIEELKNLFESFVKLIATAIDEKSPHTGGHCQRIPELTMMLAEAVSERDDGHFSEFSMTDEDKYELELAAWLHDCGKVTTPEHVLDKSTKLETIHDRIHHIDSRIDIIKLQTEIEHLRSRLGKETNTNNTDGSSLDEQLTAALGILDEEKAFIRQCNIGGEFMSEEDKLRIREIGQRKWTDGDGQTKVLLTDDEITNLTIPKGTINNQEREIINNHIVMTIKMLESLVFPKHLKNVPEYAGGHHERVDGKGYPKGLSREEMSVQARVMAIADIFEALTDPDRPYKEGMKLSRALKILGKMKLDNHIDPDLFDIFIEKKVYMQYAERFLAPEQIDEVILSEIPGYENAQS